MGQLLPLANDWGEPLSRNFLLDFHSFYGMGPPMTTRKSKIARLPFNIRECTARKRNPKPRSGNSIAAGAATMKVEG